MVLVAWTAEVEHRRRGSNQVRSLDIDSHSEAETAHIAGALAPLLRPGDVLRLQGPLGAGKTRFVQSLAAALHCTAEFVASPTFVLVHEYDGPLPVFHVDAYRLRDADEFRELGGEELSAAGGVLCVEWAERIADALPREGLVIEIEATGPTGRRFRFMSLGPRGELLLAGLEQRARNGGN